MSAWLANLDLQLPFLMFMTTKSRSTSMIKKKFCVFTFVIVFAASISNAYNYIFQIHVHEQGEIPFVHMVGLAASLSHHTYFAITLKEVIYYFSLYQKLPICVDNIYMSDSERISYHFKNLNVYLMTNCRQANIPIGSIWKMQT